MKSKLLALVLLGGSSMFAANFSVGINLGAPPPPPRVAFVRPASPGPNFVWIDGFYEPINGRYVWHAGYWGRRPYEGAFWVAPRYDGHRYVAGYWQHGARRDRFEHGFRR